MDLTVQQLRYFAAVAHELHFARAAQRLHISAPSLSQQIAALERRFGAPLFRRDARHVELTELGRELLPMAHRSIAALDEVVSWAQERRAGGAVVRVVGSRIGSVLPGPDAPGVHPLPERSGPGPAVGGSVNARTRADDRADAEQRGRSATLMQTYVEGLASTSPPGPTAPAPPVTVLRDLVFSEPATGGGLRLDLYLPEGVPGPRPVIVWLPGGGWQRAARGMGPHLGRLFAQRGYAMADVEYRSSRTALWPAQLHDVKAAVRYLRSVAQHRGLDAERVGVWGSSAGGHLAALLALTGGDPAGEGDGGHAGYSSEVQAVVDGYGPTDLRHMDEDRLPGGVVNDIDPASPPWGLLGGPTTDRPGLAAHASPVSHVSGPAAPFLILHGDADLLVGPKQSRRLFEALHGAGSEATLVSVHGAGHGFFNTDALERTPPLPTTVHTTRCGERTPARPGVLTSGLVERFFDHHLRRHFSD